MLTREGIEPRYQNKSWMPTLLLARKAIPEEPTAKAPAGPPGSETVARHYGKAGNSGGPIDSPPHGVGWHNWQTRRKPDGLWEVRCPNSSEEME